MENKSSPLFLVLPIFYILCFLYLYRMGLSALPGSSFWVGFLTHLEWDSISLPTLSIRPPIRALFELKYLLYSWPLFAIWLGLKPSQLALLFGFWIPLNLLTAGHPLVCNRWCMEPLIGPASGLSGAKVGTQAEPGLGLVWAQFWAQLSPCLEHSLDTLWATFRACFAHFLSPVLAHLVLISGVSLGLI